ncbi:hypothetical protein BGZ93_000218 [Podila epicladia]|nr:hypothetical protein BGZ92_000933 [Podila epicladia]KAG0086252.1 hypothetical protein BGZ93_000218 [Podila epicladia]
MADQELNRIVGFMDLNTSQEYRSSTFVLDTPDVTGGQLPTTQKNLEHKLSVVEEQHQRMLTRDPEQEKRKAVALSEQVE